MFRLIPFGSRDTVPNVACSEAFCADQTSNRKTRRTPTSIPVSRTIVIAAQSHYLDRLGEFCTRYARDGSGWSDMHAHHWTSAPQLNLGRLNAAEVTWDCCLTADKAIGTNGQFNLGVTENPQLPTPFIRRVVWKVLGDAQAARMYVNHHSDIVRELGEPDTHRTPWSLNLL